MATANNSVLDRTSRRRARLLLCAGFGLGVVLLTFGVTRAQKRVNDDAAFRKLIDDYCAAWSTGNTDNA